MRKLSLLFVVHLLFVAYAFSSDDTPESVMQIIADIFEQHTEETGEEIDYDFFMEELLYLSQHPVNLNNTNRQELEKMLFLSDIQVENILYYLYRYKKMFSIYELQLVEGLDMTDIRRMLHFVYVAEKEDEKHGWSWEDVRKFHRNELITRFDLIPEKRAGYIADENGITPYWGSPLYHHLKYRFKYRDRLFVNFTAEKDAGELWNLRERYDFNSFSVQYNRQRVLHQLFVGDFQAHFGQGLALSQTFSRRKSSMVTNIAAPESGFKRYGSTNEFLFFRGVAARINFQSLSFMPFISYRKMDANGSEDTITGFYTTGLHRTDKELEKKGELTQFTAGANLTYNADFFRIGLHTVYTQLDKTIEPRFYPYNLFYFRGKSQQITGANYRFRSGKFLVFGETAINEQLAMATLNGLFFNPVSRVNIAILQRYFSPEYNAIFANAFSESSRVSNENGLYFGVELTPLPRWKVAFYADSYRFPWIKYGIDAPTHGKDYLMQFQYRSKHRWQLTGRIKHELQFKNESGSTSNMIVPFSKSAFRLQLQKEYGKWQFKQLTDISHVNKNGITTYGFSSIQDIRYNIESWNVRLDFRYQIFDAANYDNRLYAYERDVLYAFSVPAFYGSGSRYYFNIRYQPLKAWSFYMKLAQTIYADDREKIGSGYELIHGNVKTEIKCLVRWNFQYK